MIVSANGALVAVGTEDTRIMFQGTEPTPGSWAGIVFQNAGSEHNAMEHVVVRHGGRETPRTGPANIRLEGTMADPTRLALAHCELRESAGYGLYVDQWSALLDSTANVFTENSLGAAYVHSTSAGWLDADTRYSGNDHDVVYVEGSRIPTETVHWPTIDVPYEVEGRTRVDGGELTIDAGTTLRFHDDAYIEVAPGQGDAMGRLTAIGTADAPIVFTGTEEHPGYWRGLAFRDAEESGSRIEHASIEFGGSSAFPMAEPANVAVLAVSRDSELDLVSVTLGPADGHCLFLGPYPDAERRIHEPIVNQQNVEMTGCGGA